MTLSQGWSVVPRSVPCVPAMTDRATNAWLALAAVFATVGGGGLLSFDSETPKPLWLIAGGLVAAGAVIFLVVLTGPWVRRGWIAWRLRRSYRASNNVDQQGIRLLVLDRPEESTAYFKIRVQGPTGRFVHEFAQTGRRIIDLWPDSFQRSGPPIPRRQGRHEVKWEVFVVKSKRAHRVATAKDRFEEK